ncbi:hypothetical protein [Streptomyces sp. NBC_00470]|uniref:hypothetical protein n=1 Tax=Streptomyces sp. NBC_00470 TaxID=2975753 RepID=UPI0030E34D7F
MNRTRTRTSWWMPRKRERPVAAATRTIASWDASVRLRVRASLLWLAQQITEARMAAEEAVEHPGTTGGRLAQVLDISLDPQLQTKGMPPGARQFDAAVRDARRIAEQLQSSSDRRARRAIARLASGLAQAERDLEYACSEVRGADLTGTDLTHLYLGGVCWDEATQWPEHWGDRVRSESDHVDGVYRVRDS